MTSRFVKCYRIYYTTKFPDSMKQRWIFAKAASFLHFHIQRTTALFRTTCWPQSGKQIECWHLNGRYAVKIGHKRRFLCPIGIPDSAACLNRQTTKTAHYLIMLATSSAKLSLLFSSPSPFSKRTKSTIAMLPPSSFAVLAVYCAMDRSPFLTNSWSTRQFSL